MPKSCYFFDDHLEKEEWHDGNNQVMEQYWPIWEQVEAMKQKYVPQECVCKKGESMNTSTILKAIGIILICTGIHFGLGGLLPLIVFGSGMGFLFLP